jgi:hypothetical protein
MIDISYQQEDNIILVERSGEISVEDLIGYINEIDHDYRELKRVYILDDSRGSVWTFNHKHDYDRLFHEIDKRVRNFIRVYVALVVDNPHQTAKSDLFKLKTEKIKNYFFQFFSSRESARSWLKMNA